MHEQPLGRAAAPAPAIVLGMLLDPYSIGHELLLYRQGNPLADQPKGSRDDLWKAVLICCQSWRENNGMVFDPLLKFKLWSMGFRKRFSPSLRRITFEQELKTFIQYRDAGSLEFPLSEVARPDRGPAPRVPGCPFTLRMWAFVHDHWTDVDAKDWGNPWDYPLGFAKMRWACHWETEQGLEVQNHYDAQHDEAYTQWLLEQEKEGAKQCRA